MMILLCELAIKSERTRLDNEIITKVLSFSIIFSLLKNLTSCAQICSSEPPFCKGTMARIPVSLATTIYTGETRYKPHIVWG